MISVVTFIAHSHRNVALSVVWFVLDKINDRNTEIIVSTVGLTYAFIFLISRRLQWPNCFLFLWRTTAYIHKVPYDQILRDEAGLQPVSRHLYLNVIFAALIELLCLFRLFSSLLGRGWGLLSDPLHRLLQTPHFRRLVVPVPRTGGASDAFGKSKAKDPEPGLLERRVNALQTVRKPRAVNFQC
jgi:hypothetical protein